MAREDSGFAEIEEYTKKLTQNPESLVFVPLAESYRKSGMLDEAIETCQKGLQLHPSYMSARMVLGRTFMEKERFEEAAAEFNKVAAADVNNIMAHSLLGQVYLKQGKHTNAIEEFQKVLTLNPDDANAQQWLQQALELAKTNGAVRSDPSPGRDARQEISQAEAYTKQGDIESALKIYRLILEADPENLVVRQRLKDLEMRQAQVSTERRGGERPKGEAFGAHRDMDKITSDDILSVMKDTLPRAPGKPAAAPAAKAEAPKAEAPKPAAKPAAPKAEAPKPAAAKDAAGVGDKSGITAEIATALTKLVQTPGIVGILLVSEQGEVLETSFGASKDLKDTAKAAALIFERTGKAVHAMGYGSQIHQILITGEKGQIFFNKFGARILLVQADEGINIGKMRLAMNDVNKVLH